MNEIQLYSVIMFFAGVAITHSVFFFENKYKKKKFYLLLSAAILQILDSVHSTHLAAVEFTKDKLKTVEENEYQEYLLKESQKVSILMEIYVLLLIKAVPSEGRAYINYRSWSEAKSLIEKLRGLSKNGQGEG